jgi:hypothetical protein
MLCCAKCWSELGEGARERGSERAVGRESNTKLRCHLLAWCIHALSISTIIPTLSPRPSHCTTSISRPFLLTILLACTNAATPDDTRNALSTTLELTQQPRHTIASNGARIRCKEVGCSTSTQCSVREKRWWRLGRRDNGCRRSRVALDGSSALALLCASSGRERQREARAALSATCLAAGCATASAAESLKNPTHRRPFRRVHLAHRCLLPGQGLTLRCRPLENFRMQLGNNPTRQRSVISGACCERATQTHRYTATPLPTLCHPWLPKPTHTNPLFLPPPHRRLSPSHSIPTSAWLAAAAFLHLHLGSIVLTFVHLSTFF